MIIENWPVHCNTENAKQGYWGELYVKRLFESQGFIVVLNPDPFGSWDMVKINPKTGASTTVQVKTLVRYIMKNYFGIKDGVTGQTIENLKSCDELILVVRNPHTIDDPKYKGTILKVNNHKNYTIIKGEYIIPSIPENLTVIGYMTPDELNQVCRFNTHKEIK